jgi:universal stress protein A
MNLYQHILVGLDLSATEAQAVINKAANLAKMNSAQLSFVHVVEPLNIFYPGDIPIDLTATQTSLQEVSEQHLAKLAEKTDYPITCSKVIVGQTATEMRHLAEELRADLIVVGCHGRHGLALLLGSTASDLLHGARCDVLAIRV